MHTSDTPNADRVLRDFARLLAPYVAEELERPRPTVSPGYDPATCTIFVSTLGTGVLERALKLFTKLADDGRISSVELAKEITIGGPRAIGGALTSPLKRRAKQLGLPLPFLGGEGAREYGGIPSPLPDDDPRRTYWQDHNGIATRMVEAIQAQLSLGSGYIDPNDPRAQGVDENAPFYSPERAKRFTWGPGDLEWVTPEEAARLLSTSPSTPTKGSGSGSRSGHGDAGGDHDDSRSERE
jgi:hypothetical protein